MSITTPMLAVKAMLGLTLLTLLGCQPLPTPSNTRQVPPTVVAEKNTVNTPDGVTITPYTQAEIKREKIKIVTP